MEKRIILHGRGPEGNLRVLGKPVAVIEAAEPVEFAKTGVTKQKVLSDFEKANKTCRKCKQTFPRTNQYFSRFSPKDKSKGSWDELRRQYAQCLNCRLDRKWHGARIEEPINAQ